MNLSTPSTRVRPLLMSAALVAGATAALALPANPAEARSPRPLIATGRCSSSGTWKLKAKHDDGLIEVEFEVDVNRNGRTYAVVITDNGKQVFKGNRTTVAPSGSFSVERRVANRAGADKFVAKATRGTNVCSGTLTLP